MERLQPKLRFSEFKEDWELKTIEEIGKLIGGGTPSTTNIELWKGNIPWISSSDLYDDNIFKINKTRFISEETIRISSTKLIPKNSILIVSRVGVGKVAIADEDICTSQDFSNLTLIEDNHIFFAYLIKLSTNRLLEFNQGTSIKGFVKSDIEKLQIFKPKLEEQTKIANFLTSVDEKINLLTQKKEALEEYKKGMMQKIFNQEIRFKDDNGEDFEDWEEKEFLEVFKSIPSKQFQIKSSEINNQGEFPVIDQGKEIIAGFSNKINKVFSDIPLIIFGDHTTILKYVDFRFIVGADGTKLLTNLNNENLKYLFYNLCFNNIEQEGYKRHYSSLTEKLIQIPTLKEQIKISNFLSSIDEKIELVSAQIEETKEYKKGLLQGMFC